jgi:ribosome maturation factor RimP
MIEQIREKIESLLAEVSLEVVDVRLGGSGGRKLVQILLDKEGGISLDDLTEVNKRVGNALDEWDLIPGAYMLEVSSAGLERPLITIEHFQRFSGRKVKILLIEPINANRRKITGYIKGVDGETVSVQEEAEEFKLDINNIKKANLVFEM